MMETAIDWSFLSVFWQWLARNQVQVGLCVAIVGAIFTLGGLLFAGIQIRAGANALLASTLYQIQKDSRELRNEALRDPEYISYVEEFRTDGTYSPEIISKAERRVGIILQFYASIFNQWRFGTLKRPTWNVVHSDLCAFVGREPVRSMWDRRLSRGVYSPEFIRAVNGCIDRAR